jgi:carbamoyl-phosphate synthase large subunit
VIDKYAFYDEARVIADELGLPLYATAGTYDALQAVGISCTRLAKRSDEAGPSAMEAIEHGLVDLVINIPRDFDEQGRPDGYQIRRAAIDSHVPLVTELKLARAVVDALRTARTHRLRPWDEIVSPRGSL